MGQEGDGTNAEEVRKKKERVRERASRSRRTSAMRLWSNLAKRRRCATPLAHARAGKSLCVCVCVSLVCVCVCVCVMCPTCRVLVATSSGRDLHEYTVVQAAARGSTLASDSDNRHKQASQTATRTIDIDEQLRQRLGPAAHFGRPDKVQYHDASGRLQNITGFKQHRLVTFRHYRTSD